MNLLLGYTTLTVFALMLSLGVNLSLQQLTSLWRSPADLARGLVSVLVLVPAVVIVCLSIFDLPLGVAGCLAILAASPGAPMTTKRSQMAGADMNYVASLQLTLALSAVVVTPLILSVFYAFFELDIERVSVLKIASQIAQVTLLPVVIGLLVQHFAPKLVDRFGGLLNKVANVMFLLLMLAIVGLLVFKPEFRAMLAVGWPAGAAIVIIAAAAVAIGHALGGPRRSQRAGLAIASVARNIGLAAFIVGLHDGGEVMFPTLLAFMLLGAAVATPYSIWIKKQIGHDAAA